MSEFNPDLHENHVELLGHYGGDKTHAASGWTSTMRELTTERIERIPAFLKRLVEGSDGKPHVTPFEKSALHFLVTGDIASHIHQIKHRIAVSVNAESARYKELLDDKFYIPTDWPEDERVLLMMHCIKSFEQYHATIDRLVEKGMDRKRAKESSRYYIPYANQLAYDVQFNFNSFQHFCKLRGGAGAQLEIREITHQMIRQVDAIEGKPFYHSIRAWGLHKLAGIKE